MEILKSKNITEIKNAKVYVHSAPWQVSKEMPVWKLQEKCRMILAALFKIPNMDK